MAASRINLVCDRIFFDSPDWMSSFPTSPKDVFDQIPDPIGLAHQGGQFDRGWTVLVRELPSALDCVPSATDASFP